jgi:hypothetical protein
MWFEMSILDLPQQDQLNLAPHRLPVMKKHLARGDGKTRSVMIDTRIQAELRSGKVDEIFLRSGVLPISIQAPTGGGRTANQ